MHSFRYTHTASATIFSSAKRVPVFKVALERITRGQAVNYVASAPPSAAATLTLQHMLYNRNALFQVCVLYLAHKSLSLWKWPDPVSEGLITQFQVNISTMLRMLMIPWTYTSCK